MGRTSAVVALSALLLAFLSLAVPLIVDPPDGRAQAWDEQFFHRPTVEIFSAALPTPDLRDYPSATGPTYHLVLAVVHRLSGGSMACVRIANLLFGCALIVVVWMGARRWVDPWSATVAALPLALSGYAIASAVWIASDDAALGLGLLTLLLVLRAPSTATRSLRSGAIAAIAVSMRQLAIWSLAPLVAASLRAWWRPRGAGDANEAPALRQADRLAFIGCLPAMVVLATLGWLWGGATPPAFRTYHATGLNLAAVPYGLALLAIWATPLLPAALVGTSLRSLVRRRWMQLVPLLALTLVIALIPETSFLKPASAPSASATPDSPAALISSGRFGGPLWALVARSPAPMDRSLLLIGLALIGVVAVTALYDRMQRIGRTRDAALITATLVAFVLTQTLNGQTFQRYMDPFLLAIVGWMVLAGGPTQVDPSSDDARAHRWRRAIGFGVLAMVQLAMTLGSLHAGLASSLIRGGTGAP